MAQKKQGYVELEWTCPNCNNENGGAVRVCGTCGTPQPDDVEFHQPKHQALVTDEKKLAKARAGADVHCAYCEARNPGNAESCSQCGGDLSEGAQREIGKVVGAFKPGPVGSVECENCGSHNATTRTICFNCGASLSVEKKGTSKPASKPSSKAKKGLSAGAIGAIILGCIGISALAWFLFFRTTEIVGTVVAVEWNRSVEIEGLGDVEGEAWYDLVPSDAENLSCIEEVRNVESDPPTGATYDEICGTPYTVDDGSGFGEVVQDCEYHVYDDKCTYSTVDWMVVDTSSLSGSNLSPQWPSLNLNDEQREGEQIESYVCVFEADGETYRYETENVSEYMGCQIAATFTLEVNTLGGVVSID